MSDISKKMKIFIYGFIKIAAALVAIPAMLVAGIMYLNWSAEREAQAFCDEITPGSDISLAITRFEQKTGKENVLHYGTDKDMGQSFLFRGFMLDKAYCDVSAGKNGRVISKLSYMLYD